MLNDETGRSTPEGREIPTYSGWKTALCQFYIQGNCNKSTDACNFAHGTSDLRTPEGNPLGFDPSHDKYKSTLCAKFLSIGSCPFGAACRFAHGVQELRKPKNKNNPLFKTTLCKLFSDSGFCHNSVNCQFAHGVAELRSKPNEPFEFTDITQEEWERRLEKARNTPGYKTRFCSKFQENNQCDYGDLCHFIHGNEVLPLGFDSLYQYESMPSVDPTYKTLMCRMIVSNEFCEYGPKCRFAHSESELRKPSHQTTSSNMSPTFSSFKTVLCSNYAENGLCKYDENCQFAHGPEELRPLPHHFSFPPTPSKYPGSSSSIYCPGMRSNAGSQLAPSPNGPRDRLLITMIRSSNIGFNVRGSSMKSKRRRYQRINNKV